MVVKQSVDVCPACSSKTNAYLYQNELLPQTAIALINAIDGDTIEHGCTTCAGDRYKRVKAAADEEWPRVSGIVDSFTDMIPIVSLQGPQGWEYDVKGLVTGQSTTGTGIFTDIASIFTDAFGAQSKSYNQKIRAGEEMCKKSLRLQTLAAGGNAILGVDIDYTDVGGDKSMLMVCMTGTAVRLRNPDILGQETAATIATLAVAYHRYAILAPTQMPAGR